MERQNQTRNIREVANYSTLVPNTLKFHDWTPCTAMAYLSLTSSDTVYRILVAYKSKVTTKQPLSIPGMELMSAQFSNR
mgnify:CR=1 FL=1